MRNLNEIFTDLSRIADRQLFFIGGAPRSGTTWLQQILDSHPEISCRGEGFFQQQLAVPLEAAIAERSRLLEEKNTKQFGHTGGYPLPVSEDTDALLATAILLALHRQLNGRQCLAIGEKTPENVFFFPRLKHLFPRAKFVGIARDPRDVLTSAWCFFRSGSTAEEEHTAKRDFIQSSLPSLVQGIQAMISLKDLYPDDCFIVTYRALRLTGADQVSRLFRFLGVSDDPAYVEASIAKNSFQTMSGGRPPGVEQRGAFLRKGAVGDWRSTLTAEHNDLILQELGWCFPYFGWTP